MLLLLVVPVVVSVAVVLLFTLQHRPMRQQLSSGRPCVRIRMRVSAKT